MSEEKNRKGKDREALYVCVVYMCVDSGENSARPVQVRLKSNPHYTRLHKLLSPLLPVYLGTFWYSLAMVHVGPR